jgi:cytochrome d ubiquinol oxidase subunit I
MQTPVAFEIADGRFVPTDWLAVMFNPSFPYRFVHTVVAVYLTTAFTVIGVAAWYLRHGRFVAESRVMIAMGVILAAVLVPAQALIGDWHGLNTLEHQPAKLAAMEGLWDTRAGQPAVLFALPDAAAEANRMEVSIPKLASLYLTHDLDGTVRGLKDFPRADRPPVAPVFFGFRIMVGMWAIMLALTLWAVWLAWRRRLFETPAFLRAATWAIPAGYIAVTAGWVTTEVGRQPFVVYGHLRTADAVTPTLTGGDVLLSLAVYVVVYAVIFGAGVYYLIRLVQRGLPEDVEGHELRPAERAARPLSAATARD